MQFDIVCFHLKISLIRKSFLSISMGFLKILTDSLLHIESDKYLSRGINILAFEISDGKLIKTLETKVVTIIYSLSHCLSDIYLYIYGVHLIVHSLHWERISRKKMFDFRLTCLSRDHDKNVKYAFLYIFSV